MPRPNTGPKSILSFQAELADADAVRDLAQRRGITESAVLRALLRAALSAPPTIARAIDVLRRAQAKELADGDGPLLVGEFPHGPLLRDLVALYADLTEAPVARDAAPYFRHQRDRRVEAALAWEVGSPAPVALDDALAQLADLVLGASIET